MRAALRGYTDVCDALFVVEVGLRLLGKAGGDPGARLLLYLSHTLQLERQISSSVAKVTASALRQRTGCDVRNVKATFLFLFLSRVWGRADWSTSSSPGSS